MPKRVLILEDNVEMLDFLAGLVKKISPYNEVMKFTSLEGVFDAVMNYHIDLFLVDIILNADGSSGDASGLFFVEKIRSVQKYEFTPVIFITSLHDPKLYAFNHLHSYSFIEKPIEPDYVKDTIRKALRFSNSNFSEPVLFFKKDGVIVRIQISDIVYIQSGNRRLSFYMNDGRVECLPYKSWQQLKLEIGNVDFFKCNRSTMINMRYVINVDLVNRYIWLKGVEEPMTIGVKHRKEVERELGHVG